MVTADMSRPSQFVDDIMRLRKAGGLVTTETSDLKRTSNKVILKSSEEALTDYPTSRILNSKHPAATKTLRSIERSPSALAQHYLGISAIFASAKRTVMTGTGGQREAGREVQRVLDERYYRGPNSPRQRRLPRPQSAPAERVHDVVESLWWTLSLCGNYQVIS